MYILHFISFYFSFASYTVMPHKSCFLVYQKAPKNGGLFLLLLGILFQKIKSSNL